MSADYLIHHGDCIDWMRGLPDNSWDMVCTDPPYGLGKPPPIMEVLLAWLSGAPWKATGKGFMGREWDAFVPGPEVWREMIRVMKPGAHAFVFSGTRTVDVMGLALRMAGFEFRDTIAWVYGSGMPKSCNIPGWTGSGIKPAFEPVLMLRKPLEQGLTLRQNAKKWGTGGLNIDGARIECSEDDFAAWEASVENVRNRGGKRGGSWKNASDLSGANPANPLGRWPANLALDEEAARQMDLFVGDRPGMSGGGKHSSEYGGGMFGAIDCEHTARADNGGPSRFFYCAKASKADREEGLDGMPAGKGGRRNTHPTIKPTPLLRWIIRLGSLPGHVVGDPFTGSGSTGKACIMEGRTFRGCELNDMDKEPFVSIARRRCRHAALGNKR